MQCKIGVFFSVPGSAPGQVHACSVIEFTYALCNIFAQAYVSANYAPNKIGEKRSVAIRFINVRFSTLQVRT